jgi:hypothetical protein
MNKLYFTIILFTTVSCNQVKNEENNNEDIISNQAILEKPIVINEKSTAPIFVDFLSKFNNHSDYYLPLFYKNAYSDSIEKIIQNSYGEDIAMNDDEESRTEIDNRVAKKYFFTEGLDNIIIINREQEIIDTVTRLNYEHYNATIESFYVATYSLPVKTNQVLIGVSTNGKINLKKSPQSISIPEYNKRINKQNNFNEEIISQTTVINDFDTISILSLVNYTQSKTSLFLLKNGIAKDSIINDYMAISSITPIPLATKNEITYLYEGYKPETDWFWNGILGIDMINWKFNLYENNRIER